MYPVALFAVALMVALVFTMITKRKKRGSRQKASNETKSTRSSNDFTDHDIPGKSLLDSPDRQETSVDTELGTKLSRLETLEKENALLKAENLKLKNKGLKKKDNLAAYNNENKKVRMATRKRRQSKLVASKPEIAQDGDGIIPRNKRTGKPKGKNGGGFKAPKEIDREVEWRLERCPHCGRSLDGFRPVGKWHHVIIDVVKFDLGMRMERVRHVIYRYRCPGCHRLVAKDFGRLAHVHYGIGLIAVVMEQRLGHRGTWDGIRENLIMFFAGQDHKEIIPTIVTFIDWMIRWEPQVRQVFEAFRDAMKNTSFAHVDETGVPMDGKNYWLWIVVTGHVILYLASESRGHETIKDIFEGYEGILISDFWTAYNKLDVEQQKCLAHLVKDLKVVECKAIDRRDGAEQKLAKDSKNAASLTSEENAIITTEDVAAGNEVETPRRGRPPKQPEPLSEADRTKLAADVEQQATIIKQVELLRDFFGAAWRDGDMGWQTPVDKRISREDAVLRMQVLIEKIRAEGVASQDIERLLKRMEKFAPKLFTYLDHPGIPPDNNHAEREIRPFIVQRKISGNFVNPDLFEIYAMMLSLYHTGLKHKVPFRDILRLLHDNDVDGILALLKLPAPAPPPPPDIEAGVPA